MELTPSLQAEIEKNKYYNTIAPASHPLHIADHIKLREPRPNRDSEYSPLHDCILSNIGAHIKKYGSREVYNELYAGSMLPERLTGACLRAFEQYMNTQEMKYAADRERLIECLKELSERAAKAQKILRESYDNNRGYWAILDTGAAHSLLTEIEKIK